MATLEGQVAELRTSKQGMDDQLKALEHHCHVDLAQHIVTLIADKESVEANSKKLAEDLAAARAQLAETKRALGEAETKAARASEQVTGECGYATLDPVPSTTRHAVYNKLQTFFGTFHAFDAHSGTALPLADTAAIKTDLELLVVHVEKQLETAKKGRAADQEKMLMAEHRADIAETNAKSSTDTAKGLTSTVTELEHELSQAKGALQRAEDERKRLIEVNDTAMDTCQDLEGREAELRGQLDEAEAEVTKMNTHVRDMEEELAALEEELATVTTKHAREDEQRDRDLAEVAGKKMALESELMTLKAVGTV